MIQAFSILPDPRTGPAQRRDLQEMIVMTLCSVLCGADNWVDVAEWAGDNEDWLKKLIRKFALTLLRQDQQYPKRSLRSR